MTLHDNRLADRYTVAANDLTCRKLDPEFANDGVSLAFVAGSLLTGAGRAELRDAVEKTGVDVIYLAFTKGDEAAGPSAITILTERSGVVFIWLDCVLWAPNGQGPLQIANRSGGANFAHDGRALINVDKPASVTLRAGMERARRRLRAAAARITDARMAMVAEPWRRAA